MASPSQPKPACRRLFTDGRHRYRLDVAAICTHKLSSAAHRGGLRFALHCAAELHLHAVDTVAAKGEMAVAAVIAESSGKLCGAFLGKLERPTSPFVTP